MKITHIGSCVSPCNNKGPQEGTQVRNMRLHEIGPWAWEDEAEVVFTSQLKTDLGTVFDCPNGDVVLIEDGRSPKYNYHHPFYYGICPKKWVDETGQIELNYQKMTLYEVKGMIHAGTKLIVSDQRWLNGAYTIENHSDLNAKLFIAQDHYVLLFIL